MFRRFFCRSYCAILCNQCSGLLSERTPLFSITEVFLFLKFTSSLQRQPQRGTLRQEVFRMVQFLIPGAAICTVYLLYRQGCAVSKCVAAVLFLFRAGKNHDKVFVDSCSGWVRHLSKFRECRVYEFTLDCQLSKGDVEVFLLDRDKRELLRLNPKSPSGSIELSKKHKYYLHWKFDHVTGKCELHW